MRHRSPIVEKISELNGGVVAIVLALTCIGLMMMVSAGGGELKPYATPQAIRFLAAFVLMIVIALVPMRILMDYAYLAYFLCLLVLIVVDVIGHIGMGAQRWLKLGGVNVQPSEFMKLAVVLALARYFHQLYPEDIKRISFLIPPLLIIMLPAIFILRQPNLGTTVILRSVGLIMLFMAGLQWRYIIIAAIGGITAAPIVWQFMHDYQKRRVLTFLDPTQDPLGAGYNILQSMIAIGSGGFLGKGYLHGSQNQLNFLPEKHTDFIFTVLGEEFGFLGAMMFLVLYFALMFSGMAIGLRSRSTFGAMLAAGITAMLFIHVVINCGMVMGMLPVVGVPLPFMSYGGSIMMSVILAMGLLLNAYVHREQMPTRSTPNL